MAQRVEPRQQVQAPPRGLALPGRGAAQLAELPSRTGRMRRRFLHNRLGVVGLGIILTVVALAILSTAIAPYHWKEQDIVNRFKGPSADHWLGTDELGRDILSRVLYGARYSLTFGIASIAFSFTIGPALGAIGGFYRKLDPIVMRLIDVMMAFPGILLAIAIAAALGPGLMNTTIAIAVNEIPGFTRLTRSLVLSLREREFVVAARVIGADDLTVVRRHILVNLVSPLIVFASLRISVAILAGATLSFLGLGIQPPIPEWGTMVSTARGYLAVAPHTFFYPTLAIFITVVAFNLLGDALRDALDPRRVM